MSVSMLSRLVAATFRLCPNSLIPNHRPKIFSCRVPSSFTIYLVRYTAYGLNASDDQLSMAYNAVSVGWLLHFVAQHQMIGRVNFSARTSCCSSYLACKFSRARLFSANWMLKSSNGSVCFPLLPQSNDLVYVPRFASAMFTPCLSSIQAV